ncbi:MAG: PKD domain-containing protein [Candidatus Omnitrophica bacterium]|nr:PKD domain-containing protein [Candidatus Omnitrophota bacterium]MBU4488076.1 PKD domain-containing protein [Candidatus Omnitrophota bacterium]MCG2705677.1 PKD domain-containing protein [Candidatus Omnitrophota bacterium]
MKTNYYFKLAKISLIACISLLLFTSNTCANISSRFLLLDDFSDAYNEMNSVGFWTGAQVSSHKDVVDGDPDYPANLATGEPKPPCHKIGYMLPIQPPDMETYEWWTTCQWWATAIWDGLNPSTKRNGKQYTHLVFDVVGAAGGEDFMVGLQETGHKRVYNVASNFLMEGGAISNTEWKTVIIPLNKYTGATTGIGVNLNTIQAIDLVFSLGTPTSTGTIYITNVRLQGVMIDNFEDALGDENLLRHYDADPNEHGTGFGGGTNGAGITTSIDAIDPDNPANRCHVITWDESLCDIDGDDNIPGNGDDNIAYLYSHTFFAPWDNREPTDTALYDTLKFRVRGAAGGETFQIAFKEDIYGSDTNIATVPVTDYITVSTTWQLVSIPLADFTGVSDKNNITALLFYFGSDAISGTPTIYIDDIYFDYSSWNLPPVIDNFGPLTFYVDRKNSFYLPARDPEGDILFYEKVVAPYWLTLNPVTGLVTGKPDASQQYSHGGIKFKVKDSKGGNYTMDPGLTIDVLPYSDFEKPQSTGRVRVDSDNKKLIVDGREFKIKGVGYNPVPVGIDPVVDTWDGPTITMLQRDMPNLADLRVNTIRTWNDVNADLFDYAGYYGKMVCAAYWVDSQQDFRTYTTAGAANRTAILNGFRQFVMDFRDEEQLLMWVLGNEIDYSNRENLDELYGDGNFVIGTRWTISNGTYVTIGGAAGEEALNIQPGAMATDTVTHNSVAAIAGKSFVISYQVKQLCNDGNVDVTFTFGGSSFPIDQSYGQHEHTVSAADPSGFQIGVSINAIGSDTLKIDDIVIREANAVTNLIAWYDLANEMAKLAYKLEGATYHPVAVSSAGIVTTGSSYYKSDDASMNYIDIWGINAYTGRTFTYPYYICKSYLYTNFFDEYVSLSDKPLWIAEYGIDSIVTTGFDASGFPSVAHLDMIQHSDWSKSLTDDILASNACIGGTLMSYSDEWWKDDKSPGHNKTSQDLGGYDSSNITNDVHPDDYSNEEHWGLFWIADNGTDPDILTKKAQVVDTVTYCTFDILRDNCFNNQPVITELGTLTFYVGETQRFYVIAGDPDGDPLKPITADISSCSGATFLPDASGLYGVFEWTPSVAGGPYDLYFTVIEDDNYRTGIKTKTVNIKINVLASGVDNEWPVVRADIWPAGGMVEAITVTEGTTLRFDGSLSYDIGTTGGGIAWYTWDLDYDGITFVDSPGTAGKPVVESTFSTPGTYVVALKVADNAGHDNIDTLTVTVLADVDRVHVFDSTGSIQNAVYAVAGGAGDEVYVWSDTYTEDIVLDVNQSGIPIIGDDVSGCVLKGNVVFKEAAGASIERFTIEYPSGDYVNLVNAVYPSPGINVLADAGVTMINCSAEVKNCSIHPDPDANPPLPDKYGKGVQVFNLYNTGNITPNVENNLIRGADTGILLFSQAFGGAIWGTSEDPDGDNGIHRNTIDNVNYGIVERMHKENPEIYNNIITNAQDGVHLTYHDSTPGLTDARVNNIKNNDFFTTGSMHNIWCDELGITLDPIAGNVFVDPAYNGYFEPTAWECTQPGNEMGWRVPE